MIFFAIVFGAGFALRRIGAVLLTAAIVAVVTSLGLLAGPQGPPAFIAAAMISFVAYGVAGAAGIGVGYLVNGKRKFGAPKPIDRPRTTFDLGGS